MDVKTPIALPDFADLLLDAVVMVDVRGRVVYVNAASERIFGYTPDEMIGKSLIEFVLAEDRARTWEEAMHVVAGHARIGFENRYVRKDGRIVHIMWSARWSEEARLRIGVARDVTEKKRAEAVQAAVYAISEAAHSTGDLVALFREVHRVIASLVPVTGFVVAMCEEHDGLIDIPYQLDSYGDSPLVQESTARRLCTDVIRSRQPILLQEKAASRAPGTISRQDDGESWLAAPLILQERVIGALIVKSSLGVPHTEKDKELLQYVSTQVATAIERQRLHAELQRLARHDDLTGLPNRRSFHDRVDAALARARREDKRAAVLYIDLDDFKQVNDSLGHATGDLLLQEIARRMKQCVRKEDTVARLGGDEFVILLEHIEQPEDAMLIAEKIRAATQRPIVLRDRSLQMFPSIGIALYPDHGDRIEQLLKHADEAMYLAKKAKPSVTG
ncbi:MAG TPA: diguanylate cyclase [Noviherbaspirillum sp.]|uniref:sensor domain-containing protein n=1 Tax=Noviherbaspirillum sp. TaxID=1926288 RepID=UPI002B4649B3|nr:diguanylate cyclase [Noviherbaspirillum sp.]HJV84626.1 diguanylate cyclase [Noviherbaspirillum sp.]